MTSANDMKAAERSYEGFTRLFKWGTIAAIFFAILAVIFITS